MFAPNPNEARSGRADPQGKADSPRHGPYAEEQSKLMAICLVSGWADGAHTRGPATPSPSCIRRLASDRFYSTTGENASRAWRGTRLTERRLERLVSLFVRLARWDSGAFCRTSVREGKAPHL